MQQSIQQGLQEGESYLILRQLNRRFGEISDELVAKVKSLPIDELENLSLAIFDFQSLAYLHAWLENKGLC